MDSYLTGRLHRYSRAEVQRLIAAGRVFLRGRVIKSSLRVMKDDRVIIRYPRREEPPPRHDSLPVLYEDDAFLAVNKPGDVLSHPTDKVLLNSVTSILRAQIGRPLHLAHRLDRETSGVLVLAKNPAAARALTDAFTLRRVAKEYLAIVSGKVEFSHKRLSLKIGREDHEIKVRQAAGSGQAAVTDFECLGRNKKHSLVRALPRTGRLHQIRVHLASLGHPIVGDKLYTGAGETYLKACRHQLTPNDLLAIGAERQMLHAWKVTLPHPSTGKNISIAAPPPEDFLSCGRRLLGSGFNRIVC